jgi:hypothetical protein
MFPRAAAAGMALCALAWTDPAAAQDSRTAILEAERAEKASKVQPYRPGKLERALLFMERKDPLRKIAPHNGFFVQYGYQFKPVGSGLGLGGGFRHDLWDRRARVVLDGGVTLRSYWMARGDFSLPSLAGGHLEVGIQASRRHDPQEDFWGLGPASVRDNRVSFRFDRRELQGRVVAKPFAGAELGVRIGRVDPSIGPGTDARFPSIEERFGPLDTPGLAVQPQFSYSDVFAVVDYRDQPGNARSGGYYSVSWRDNSDLDFDRFSFRRADLDLQQFFPIFDKKRVIALRGRLAATSADAGQVVPFYFQPTLGGSDSLRSVRDFRFRDGSMMFMNAEYRWEAFSGLDMALFADWGQVAPRAADLDFDDLKHAYGIGFRFNTYRSVFLRIDVATGAGESVSYFFKFSKAF